MNESITISEQVKAFYTNYASLAGLGMHMKHLAFFDPILEGVRIPQKTVRYAPEQKLLQVEMNILAGVRGPVQSNKVARGEPGLQAAFGCAASAEQSVLQDTLDASTAENVRQLRQAIETIFRTHSRAYRHDFGKSFLLLEVDQTGRPCGRKAKFASKSYFDNQRNRCGRQVDYVVASQEQEVVVEEVYDGKSHLSCTFQELVERAEQGLELDEFKRSRTILRADSGVGSVENVNWALKRGYQYHGKDYSHERVKHLVESVTEWVTDPHEPGRQVGWVTEPTELYCRPLKRIAVRCRKHNGQWGRGVILSSLPPEVVRWLTGQSVENRNDPQAVLLAYVYFYDQRGGGVEITIKQDKQGLGTTHRNKKRFPAQQMVVQLEALAHNILVWAKRWLQPFCQRLGHWGLLRWVRDVWHMNGALLPDASGQIVRITLSQADPLAHVLCRGLSALLSNQQVATTLGEI
jgi:hypothetical protein